MTNTCGGGLKTCEIISQEVEDVFKYSCAEGYHRLTTEWGSRQLLEQMMGEKDTMKS